MQSSTGNSCMIQSVTVSDANTTTTINNAGVAPIGGHLLAMGGHATSGSNTCAKHKDGDLVALATFGSVCASLGSHQSAAGTIEASQMSQVNVPGTTEVRCLPHLQTPYITSSGLEVGVELEEFSAHRGPAAGCGMGVMTNTGSGVVVQSVPIHYLAVTAQTLAVTRTKQGAGGSLSDGHDNSDPSDQAGELEIEQDSRSSVGGFGEDSDNNVTAATLTTAVAAANSFNHASVNDNQNSMGTLTRQHAAAQKQLQQHQQLLAGSGLGLPVGGLCSRHQAMFGQFPLDVLPQLAPMPSLSMAGGEPTDLISLGQNLSQPPPPHPSHPSSHPGKQNQPVGGHTVTIPTSQMEITSLDAAAMAAAAAVGALTGCSPPQQSVPLTLQAPIDGSGTATHTLPRHHTHTQQQQQTQLVNGTLRGGTLLYGPSGTMTEVVQESHPPRNSVGQTQLPPSSAVTSQQQNNSQVQNQTQTLSPSMQNQIVGQFSEAYTTTSEKLGSMNQTQLAAMQGQLAMTAPVPIPTSTAVLHHPLQTSTAPPATGCT